MEKGSQSFCNMTVFKMRCSQQAVQERYPECIRRTWQAKNSEYANDAIPYQRQR